jgi:hypothetical protein
MEFAIMQRTADGSDFEETRKTVSVKKGWKLSDVRENIDLDENNGPWVFFDKGEGEVFDYEHEGNTPAENVAISEDYENEDNTPAEDVAISEDYENEDKAISEDYENEIINLTKENSDKEKEIKRLQGIINIENENSGDNSEILEELKELQGLFQEEVNKTDKLHIDIRKKDKEVEDQKYIIESLNNLKTDLEAKEDLVNEKERTIENKVNEKSKEQIEAAELRAIESEGRAKESEGRVNDVNEEINRVISDKERAVSAKDTKIKEIEEQIKSLQQSGESNKSEEFLIKIMNVLNPQSEFDKLTQKFNKLADKTETAIEEIS